MGQWCSSFLRKPISGPTLDIDPSGNTNLDYGSPFCALRFYHWPDFSARFHIFGTIYDQTPGPREPEILQWSLSCTVCFYCLSFSCCGHFFIPDCLGSDVNP